MWSRHDAVGSTVRHLPRKACRNCTSLPRTAWVRDQFLDFPITTSWTLAEDGNRIIHWHGGYLECTGTLAHRVLRCYILKSAHSITTPFKQISVLKGEDVPGPQNKRNQFRRQISDFSPKKLLQSYHLRTSEQLKSPAAINSFLSDGTNFSGRQVK